MIYGLTIQRVGKTFELRCPECTCLTGRLGLIRQDGPPIRLYCRLHPGNCGQWHSEAEIDREKLSLAERSGLTETHLP